MKYRCRPGIVMEKICGVRLLIPTVTAFEAFPRTIRLSLPAAMSWELLKREKPVEDIHKVFSILTKKSDTEVQQIVDSLLSSLVESGALIAEEEE